MRYRPSPHFKVDLENALIGTPDQVRARLREYASIGCQRFILIFLDYPHADAIDLFSSNFL